jgi:hypothetical protein
MTTKDFLEQIEELHLLCIKFHNQINKIIDTISYLQGQLIDKLEEEQRRNKNG